MGYMFSNASHWLYFLADTTSHWMFFFFINPKLIDSVWNEGWELGNFLNLLYIQNSWTPSAFYYLGPVFDFKKILVQAILPTKQIMHNPKVRKISIPQKIAQHPPLEKIMVTPSYLK